MAMGPVLVKAPTCHYCGEVFATPMQRMLHEERMHEGGAESEKDSMFQRSEPSENALALDAMLKGEDVDFCDCCSAHDIEKAVREAGIVLVKAKKKPFHGYNKKRHARTGGLSAKGRAHFKRTTGANLKRPVTKKPSKLKRGGKAAKRRKSFCARMGGMPGPTSKKGKLTPKGAALKRWNC